MKYSMGKTTIHCRNCQKVTEIESQSLETMAEFRCPKCGVPMSAPDLARVKILYYVEYLAFIENGPFAQGIDMFRVNIGIDPHCE